MNAQNDQDIPRKVAASQGMQWVLEGFSLYRKNPLLLSAAFGALFGLVMILGILPGIGNSLSEMVTPIMIAGFMAAYRALDDEQKLEPPRFLEGAKRMPVPLITLGAVQLLATVVIQQIMVKMGFDPQAVMAAARNTQSGPAEMQAIMNQSLPAVLVGLSLFIPLMMATWFAPALVLFGNARPLTALGVSLKASLRNLPAMIVVSMVLTLLLMLAMLVPMLLGLLFAMPVLFGAMYASYQAVFAVWKDTQPDPA